MAPIYSHQLVNHQYMGAFTGVIYTVPANTTVVVTDVDVLWSGASGHYIEITLGACSPIWHHSGATETITQQWVGKQVLNAGDTIQLLTEFDVTNVGITGYVLS
jgi:hypothetical protein